MAVCGSARNPELANRPLPIRWTFLHTPGAQPERVMPLTFKIDHEKRFVQIDPDGAVTLGAWVSANRPIKLFKPRTRAMKRLSGGSEA